ncbi:MAG TPA: protein phosphatase 2C domain-containing protein, partial [Ktedonobacteraceae bacterium]|nr:protein phosphatase 2C domain-containing protein [Ktedonobacteraceae bacterium]
KKCGQAIHAEANVVSDAARVSPTPAPTQESINAADDISLAPTQIISPQQMLAFHASRWQKEQEQEQSGTSTTTEDPTTGVEVEDIPTVLMKPPADSEPASSPAADAEAIPIPPPPPMIVAPATETPPLAVQSGMAPEGDKTPAMAGKQEEPGGDKAPAMIEVVAPADAAPTTLKEEDDGVTQTPSEQPEQTEQTQQAEQAQQTQQPGQPEQPAASSDFPALAAGTTVIGRYEITQVVSEGAQEHVYEVIDHQGYQHCWNCNSEQNREDDEFCIDCGAELLNASYNMHEYPATESHDTDAAVLQGTIMNTFIDQGRTYVIEQVKAEENAFPNGVHLLAASDSDAGDVRRSEPNEDSTLVLMLQRIHESKSAPSGVFIVADGLGGHDNGQVASRMTINIIAERMVRELLAAPLASEKAGKDASSEGKAGAGESKETQDKPDEDVLVSLLQGAVEDANAAICEVNQRDKTDMGSTITGFMVAGDYAYILNVGDSRTYMLRGGQIYQLTTDHSLVGQLVAGGLISPDDVYTHPQRSQIFRSLGDKLNVQIDIFKQQLHPGDILLSCCDGLWEMVRNPQIESILNNAPDPQIACTQLLEAANTNGGEDNVSAVVVFVH